MDHLMPGMDGFQAVQAIKNNPRTATIPIMMYTSQEGELYLSQARALGAIGVLPKQIKHADVSKALEQLSCWARPRPRERDQRRAVRSWRMSTPCRASVATDRIEIAHAHRTYPSWTAAPRNRPEPAGRCRRSCARSSRPWLAHHMRELQRFVAENLENQADRIVGDVRLLLQDQVPPAGRRPAQPRPQGGRLWLAVLACIAGGAVFGLAVAAAARASLALSAQLAQSQQQLSERATEICSRCRRPMPRPRPAAVHRGRQRASGRARRTSSSTRSSRCRSARRRWPGARLERIQALLSRLNAQGFHGVVQIRSIPGRFCMVTAPSGNPVLAERRACPTPSAIRSAIRARTTARPASAQSVAFANMIATARENAGGKMDIQISAGNRR